VAILEIPPLFRDGWEIPDDPHVIAYGELVISDLPLQLLVVDVEQVEVKKWIPARPIENCKRCDS